MRRIVICNDGTWNTAESEDRGKRKPTNITKIARAVRPVDDDGISQITFYDEGVGTGWAQKFMGGITGLGLSANVIDSYQFLSHNYQPGDEIYIFGFSRGAYTSRSLTGLLNRIGLVLKDDVFWLPELYRLYRDQANAEEIESFYNDKKLTRFDPPIKMIGVFDTVGALGIPIANLNSVVEKLDIAEFQFHDTTLSPQIEYAYHALAIDEQRGPFEPTLWKKATKNTKEMEQRWFAGVHSNIGGGYEKDGLANLALKYITDKAESCGLACDKKYLSYFRGRHDHEMRDSMSWFYRLAGKHIRKISIRDKSNQAIDYSVYRRVSDVAGYSPKNLPE